MTNWEKLRPRLPKWMRNMPDSKVRRQVITIFKYRINKYA